MYFFIANIILLTDREVLGIHLNVRTGDKCKWTNDFLQNASAVTEYDTRHPNSFNTAALFQKQNIQTFIAQTTFTTQLSHGKLVHIMSCERVLPLQIHRK